MFEKFRSGQVPKFPLRKFAGVTSGDLRAGSPEATRKFGKNWPGYAARALSEDPKHPPNFGKISGKSAAEKGLGRAQPIAASTTIRPEYRCSGPAVHGFIR